METRENAGWKITILVFLLLLGGFCAVMIPATVTALQDGDYTFTLSGNDATIIGYTGHGEAITIPTWVSSDCNVVAIGAYAFLGNENITSVTMGAYVTTIGAYAFYNCTKITSVEIPMGVTTIEAGAFSHCPKLTTITVAGGNSIYANQDDGVLYNKANTTLIQYPGGKAGAFAVPNSVTSIGDSAFEACTSLTSVSIPASVTSIGDYA
ncbi:MAG: leucine-rich repeat domain-containing protein, partial [Methanomassiliicoccales archaeon]